MGSTTGLAALRIDVESEESLSFVTNDLHALRGCRYPNAEAEDVG